MAKKNIMLEFAMDEISGVDRPAQVGARKTLMKRNSRKEESDEDDDLMETEDEGEGEDKRRTRKNTDTTSGVGGQQSREEDTMTTKTEKTADDIAQAALITKLEGELAEAKTLAGFSDAEKAHLGTLEGGDRTEFLGKNAEQRDAVLKNLADSNPVIETVGGVEYRKNDDPRLLAMAKRQAATEKALRLAEDARQGESLAKRAGLELGNLPGDTAPKVALLKAIDGIEDEATRKSIGELLKAANDAPGLSEAFKSLGVVNAPNATPVSKNEAGDRLETLAKAYAESNKVDIVDARVAVLSTAEGDSLYRQTL